MVSAFCNLPIYTKYSKEILYFFLIKFKVFPSTFKSLNHLTLISVYGLKQESNSIFAMWITCCLGNIY